MAPPCSAVRRIVVASAIVLLCGLAFWVFFTTSPAAQLPAVGGPYEGEFYRGQRLHEPIAMPP